MQVKKIHPSDLVLRCLALQRKGYWVAMCIDLDLVVQADDVLSAQQLLNAQITDYIADAYGTDSAHAVQLLSRSAPLKYFALYYAIKWLNYAKRYFSYETAMPLPFAHA